MGLGDFAEHVNSICAVKMCGDNSSPGALGPVLLGLWHPARTLSPGPGSGGGLAGFVTALAALGPVTGACGRGSVRQSLCSGSTYVCVTDRHEQLRVAALRVHTSLAGSAPTGQFAFQKPSRCTLERGQMNINQRRRRCLQPDSLQSAVVLLQQDRGILHRGTGTPPPYQKRVLG